MTRYLFFLLVAVCSLTRASSNLSLPNSQQPGPLVGFGENIIDKRATQVFLYGDAYIGNDTYATDIIPGVVYGVREDLSLFFNVPFTPANAADGHHSSGLADIFLQPEYAFYTKETPSTSFYATVVANVTFPTGSSTKNPATGYGAPTFFVGTTYNYTTVKWIFFTAYGGIFPQQGEHIKFGNQFLYQYGIGRNIPSPSGWIFAWIIEGDGTYVWKNKNNLIKEPNSGGNTFYITPCLWVSSSRILLQLGVGYPVIQHLFGNEPTNYLSVNLNFGVTF